MLIFVKDFPDYITITSSGPAAERHPYLMGRYQLETDKSAQLRPVYKKTDRDVFIFYSGKFYIMMMAGSGYLSLQELEDGWLVLI